MWFYLSLGIALLCYYLFRRSIKHLLAANDMFPGPTTIPLLGNALQLFLHRHELHKWFGDVIWYYRRSCRVWILNSLNICVIEPEDAEKILSSRVHIEKSDQYDNLLDWIGRGLLTSYGDKWAKSRKILTPAFHFTILENFLEIFHRNGDTLMEKLESKISPKNFDVYELIKLYALDNICEAAMGIKLNAQHNPNSEYVTSIKSMCEIVLSRALAPWFWPSFLFNLSSLGARQRKALNVIHGLTNKVIAQRKEELKNIDQDQEEVDDCGVKRKKVFLDILLQSSEEGGLTSEEIRQEVDTFMFEGHDTVTSAISFALYCLAENPTCQEKAYEEIHSIFGDSDRAPTFQDLQDMKYLEMAIKETLRLYPSVPIFGRYVHEDIVLDERATVPKGSQVLILVHVLHQRRGVWEKPDKFYPEHFEIEAAAERHPYQYIPFSAGPRNCIGMRFAMLEMKSTLSRILRNFRILPASPAVPLEMNVDLILVSYSGIQIRIEKRTKV